MSQSPITPDLQSKIAEWRKRAVTGDLSQEECIAAVRLLREGRMEAAKASTQSRTKKAKAEIPDAGALLAEMGR